jgi:hypothetical protein
MLFLAAGGRRKHLAAGGSCETEMHSLFFFVFQPKEKKKNKTSPT